MSGRADWHLRANAIVIAYLGLALISGFFHRGVEGGRPVWLTVHLLLLGAITNAIVTWSDHFINALLWAKMQNRSRQMRILVLLNVGVLGVLASVFKSNNLFTLFFGILTGGTVAYYLHGIFRLVRSSLNKKFVGVIRFYQFAGISLLVGIILGIIDVYKMDGDPWQPRIALAHLHVNLLGWVGLTIVGTLVTLWPTVLRTQMHPKAISSAVLGLKVLLVGVLATFIGPLVDLQWIVSIGDLIYFVGVIIALAPTALLLRRRLPDSASSWMLLTGTFGLVILLISDAVIEAIGKTPEKVLSAIQDHLLLIATLWLLPILLGALTHLLPVVLGRGPSSTRVLEATIGFGWQWRLSLLPLSSLFLVLHGGMVAVGETLLIAAVGLFFVFSLITLLRGRTR